MVSRWDERKDTGRWYLNRVLVSAFDYSSCPTVRMPLPVKVGTTYHFQAVSAFCEIIIIIPHHSTRGRNIRATPQPGAVTETRTGFYAKIG